MGTDNKPARTFTIAEAASSWRFGPTSQHLDNAYRMIAAAKECDASAAKFQWTSDPVEMSQRRNDFIPAHYEILAYPFDWLEKLKAKCDEVGIEFMCTVFLQKDIATIAPLVKRFKIASAESTDDDFVIPHFQYKKPIIASYAFGSTPRAEFLTHKDFSALHCVCSYPAPKDQLNLGRLQWREHFSGESMFSGYSDHSAHVFMGALAVAAGAKIIEAHIRLLDTPQSNPDYPHSLICEGQPYPEFKGYCENIRMAERIMGSGEHELQECEKGNIGRRVGVKH